MDREDYSASIHSSDGGSEADASSVVFDEPLLDVIKRAKKRGLARDYADKLDENYCALCGTIHVETCIMVQNPNNLVEYRAMLMEVTNEEAIEIRVSGFILARPVHSCVHELCSAKQSRPSTRSS